VCVRRLSERCNELYFTNVLQSLLTELSEYKSNSSFIERMSAKIIIISVDQQWKRQVIEVNHGSIDRSKVGSTGQ
jgi:hypothetical protein